MRPYAFVRLRDTGIYKTKQFSLKPLKFKLTRVFATIAMKSDKNL